LETEDDETSHEVEMPELIELWATKRFHSGDCSDVRIRSVCDRPRDIRDALGQRSATDEKDHHLPFTTGSETKLCVKTLRRNVDILRPGDGMISGAFGIAKSAQTQPDQASALLDLMRTPASADQQHDELEDGELDPEAEISAVMDALADRIGMADDVEPGHATPAGGDGDEAHSDDEGTARRR
jgi:hypothetical protein